ncbi:MAG TPA: hypothetical protein VGN15_00100, partial [Ktedonobacteraceae bacterium]|nr:hypothetical protein [Ktedonobacteraceae bacterium]
MRRANALAHQIIGSKSRCLARLERLASSGGADRGSSTVPGVGLQSYSLRAGAYSCRFAWCK